MSYRGITHFTDASIENLKPGSFVIRKRTESGKSPSFYGSIMIVFDEAPAETIKQTGKVNCFKYDKLGEVRFKKIGVKELAVISPQ